jgi:hypothetical protein
MGHCSVSPCATLCHVRMQHKVPPRCRHHVLPGLQNNEQKKSLFFVNYLPGLRHITMATGNRPSQWSRIKAKVTTQRRCKKLNSSLAGERKQPVPDTCPTSFHCQRAHMGLTIPTPPKGNRLRAAMTCPGWHGEDWNPCQSVAMVLPALCVWVVRRDLSP